MKVILFFTWLSALAAQGDVQVSASLDRSTAEVGETVVLTVSIQAITVQSPEIRNPELDGFEIIGTADRSSFRFSSVAGSVREVSRQYTLRIERAGPLTIPPIQVTIDGRHYETVVLQLVAVSSNAAAALPMGLEPRPGEEVAVRLWVEPETAYVGQQVTMTVAAFFDPLVRSRLQRQPEYRPPEVQGFWTTDLPGPARPVRRTVGGREYYVQIYRRALFPLSPGRIQIPAAAVIYEVRRGLIYAPETFHVESAPASVTVLPTPANQAPPGFAGAVGRYEGEVSFDRSSVAAGEAVNLILDVTGEGNIRALPRPELPPVANLRVYEGAEETETQVRGTQLTGHKRFSWVLIPERAGRYIIPELTLPHFDPATGAYRIAHTEPMTLEVTRSPMVLFSAVNRGASAIRFIKDEPSGEPHSFHRALGFWIALALPLVLLAGAQAVSRYRRGAGTRARRRRRPRKGSLKGLRQLAESGEAYFFSELRAQMLKYLEARLHLAGRSRLGLIQIQQALEDAGVPPSITIALIDLLEQCGWHRYSPNPPGTAERLDLLEQAEKLLAVVDKEAVSKKRLSALSDGGKMLAVLALVGVGAVPVQLRASQAVEPADAGALFRAGISAYSRGDYRLAAEDFESALAQHPFDAHIQYNLGNAYYGLGESGMAVAMWMRALQLKPRDSDARYNLLLAVGDDPVLGSSLPPIPLSKDELAMLLAVLWTAGCALLLARLRWRRAYLAVTGSAALILALVSAAILLAPRADYAIVVSQEAAVRAGPVSQSEVLGFPAPGTGYRVKERRGEWLRVTRAGESEGWVNAGDVAVISGRG